jgi:hypothetical protein
MTSLSLRLLGNPFKLWQALWTSHQFISAFCTTHTSTPSSSASLTVLFISISAFVLSTLSHLNDLLFHHAYLPMRFFVLPIFIVRLCVFSITSNWLVPLFYSTTLRGRIRYRLDVVGANLIFQIDEGELSNHEKASPQCVYWPLARKLLYYSSLVRSQKYASEDTQAIVICCISA